MPMTTAEVIAALAALAHKHGTTIEEMLELLARKLESLRLRGGK